MISEMVFHFWIHSGDADCRSLQDYIPNENVYIIQSTPNSPISCGALGIGTYRVKIVN